MPVLNHLPGVNVPMLNLFRACRYGKDAGRESFADMVNMPLLNPLPCVKFAAREWSAARESLSIARNFVGMERTDGRESFAGMVISRC